MARPLSTETLLQGLITECHGVIREILLPEMRQSPNATDRRYWLGSINDLMGSAVRLSDARRTGGLREGVGGRLRRRHAVGRALISPDRRT